MRRWGWGAGGETRTDLEVTQWLEKEGPLKLCLVFTIVCGFEKSFIKGNPELDRPG